MSDKRARKFDKLLEAHKDARQTRKVAASARREVKGLDGRHGAISVLSSPAGAKAVEVEVEALKAERRALKRLYAFAVKNANSVVVSIKAGAAERRAGKSKSSKVVSSRTKPAKGKHTKSKTTSTSPKAKAGTNDGDHKA